ncbi:hypothetical protein ABT354_37545 [Streptomyces sp. NPDC000594]|uniref:hypothetical protein n=1 Tax=Streptomyces sp. NPDC000594 TaxID=3154261 RepID=UPI003330DEF5
MSITRSLTVATAAVCGLVLGASPAAAEVEPGGWTQVLPLPTPNLQERGCGVITANVFELTCSTNSGDQRAEYRYPTYTNGTHQFEGRFRVESIGGSRISLKQTFRESPNAGSFFLLSVENGGRLYSVHGGDTVAPTGTAAVGTTVRVNTVHQVGVAHRTYINGSLAHTDTTSVPGSYYDKLGAYRTASGQGPVKVTWGGVKMWTK